MSIMLCRFCKDSKVRWALSMKDDPDAWVPACRECAADIVEWNKVVTIVDALAIWTRHNKKKEHDVEVYQ